MLTDYPKQWKIRTFLAGIVLLLSMHLSAQNTNLYTENFNYADGTITSSKWTINTSNCNLSGANSHFSIQAQDMEGRDLNGEAVWMSNVVNITGYQQVNLSMSVTRTGVLTSSDYIKISYILNNGTEIPFATNGYLSGSFTPGTALQNGLTGNTVQIVVRMNNNSSAKKQRFGSISITGVNPVIVPLTVSNIATPANCSGQSNGSVILTVSGGTQPYAYTWSNGTTTNNLSAVPQGVYTVTVTDATGATITSTDTVGQLPSMQLSFTTWNASPSLSDGFARVSITGGASPYNISWAGGSTNATLYHLVAGNYIVTVTDANQCAITGTANIITSNATTLVYEDFDSLFSDHWNTVSFDGNYINHWAVLKNSCSLNGYSLEIMNNTTPCSYNKAITQDILTYIPVNATGFDSLVLSFAWASTGEENYDFGTIWYSTDSVNWIRDTLGGDGSGWYEMTPTPTIQNLLLPDSLKNKLFYIGFNWQNDNNLGTDPPIVIDDISITGKTYVPLVLTPNTCNWLGTYSTLWTDTLNWDCNHVPLATDNVIIDSNTPFTPIINTTEYCYSKNLTFQSNSNLTMPGGTNLKIYGDIQSSSIIQLTGGTVTLPGDSVQHINFPAGSQFYNLTVQNSSDSGVVLQTNIGVANTISLVNGYVVTGSDTVMMLNAQPNGTSILSYSDQSHIVGNMRRYISPSNYSYEFPVGNMGDSALFVATIIPNNLQGVNYLNATFAPLTNCDDRSLVASDTGVYYSVVCPEGVWVIEPDNSPSTGTYDLKLGTQNIHLLQDNLFGILERPVGADASGFGNGGGTLPADSAAGRMVADGYARRNGLAGFSEFGIARIIKENAQNFISGQYNPDSNNVTITWHHILFGPGTIVLRSLDGEAFTQIAPPAAFGPNGNSYSVNDNNPSNGLVFYRLQVTDSSGTHQSDVIVVNSTKYADDQLSVFPNPTRGPINLRLQTKENTIDIVISDVNGNTLYTYSTYNTGSVFEKTIDLSGRVAPGTYFIRVITKSETFIRKVNIAK